MSKDNRRLKNLLINTDFQGKFIAIFVIFGFFQAFVNYFAIYMAFQQVRAAAYSAGMAHKSELSDYISLQQFYVTSFIGFAFALSFLIFVFVGIRFTHQAAGPLHHFKTEFNKMKETKKLHKITLREHDFFKDVEGAFNEMVTEIDPGAVKPAPPQ